MNIYQSAEDYLEVIYMLSNRMEHVRSIDIVNEMGFSKPSVSVAMKKLRENGYIKMDTDGYITLTDQGSDIAIKIYSRHEVLSNFLVKLGIDEEIAAKDACKMEHILSEDTYAAIKRHVESLS